MSAIAPNTDLYLLKCPIEADNRNQITFANATAQYNYFNSLNKVIGTSFTYQRKDSIIRFPACYDDICQYNYVMYRNTSYGNKWFYAFITKMEYINDNMTAVQIKTDVFQTWQFDFVYKKSFVEREHTNDDTIGANTIPELLETGPYIHHQVCTDYIYGGFANTVTVIGVTDDSVYQPSFPAGVPVIKNIYNGVYSGLTYYVIKHTNAYATTFKDFIAGYTGKTDAIYTMFEVPASTALDNNLLEVGSTGIFYVIGNLLPYDLMDISVARPSTLSTYTPRNKKLLTAPYQYFYVSNNAGCDIDYAYEEFATPSNIKFAVKHCVTAGGALKAYPQNYLNTTGSKDNYNAGVTGGKFPICAWTTDVYTNWLTQNAVNIENGILSGFLSSAVSMGASAASFGMSDALKLFGSEAGSASATTSAIYGTSSALSTVTGGIGQIGSLVGELTRHALMPPQAHGDVNSGDITYANTKAGFTVHNMCIKPEYAKVLDDYFDALGYKTNRLKVPNITGRRYWNYVKTVGANIEGNVPQEDIEELKTYFDNGITFWHDPSKYLDYSQSNTIVS